MSFTFLGFVDVNGALRGKSYDNQSFDKIRERGSVPCTDLLLAVDPLDVAITTIEGVGVRSGSGDLLIRPAVETLRELPWRPGSRTCIGDLRWTDGSPCELSTRGLLERALTGLEGLGLEAVAAFEYEFRLAPEGGGDPVTEAQGYSVRGVEAIADFAEALQEACLALDLGLTALHTEGGAGLIEANTAPAPARVAADNAVLLRQVIHEVARRNGLRASFLAKTDTTEEGSSGHLHVSIWDGERNAMAPAAGEPGPGKVMRHALGGLVSLLPAMSLFMAPNINSYKRLVPGFFAPVNASWGVDNRSTAVRAVSPNGDDARVELRRPGADANPYLALASAILSITTGLEGEIDPPPEFVGDAYASDSDACPLLPCSLEAAINAFLADPRTGDLVGPEFADYYAKTRAWELRAWQETVTDWERNRYRLIT
ncbi:MAG: glutamine synthetase [Actinobacteria bacterium]|nr:glutamine synthetase [Actinomycetota bacterium]